MEFERPELTVPGVMLIALGTLAAFTALTAYDLGFGFTDPRNQYLVGAAAIFAGVYMLDKVYGFVGRS